MGIEDKIDRQRAEEAKRVRREERERRRLSPAMEKAHARALQVFKESSIREIDFKDIYGNETIKTDLQKVIEFQKKWKATEEVQEHVTNAIAEVLEAIILSEGELSQWLGDAHTVRTATYDDYVNGVDMVSEWYSPEDGSRILALAIDVTFGTVATEKKLKRIRDEIDRGELGSIKYFTDIRGDYFGTRRNVPRVVIGVSQDTVEKLAELWMSGDKKALGAHPVQRVIVEEIFLQLRAMQDYALSTGSRLVADAYTPAIHIIGKLLEEKRKIGYGDIYADRVVKDLFFKTAKIFSK